MTRLARLLAESLEAPCPKALLKEALLNGEFDRLLEVTRD